MVAIEKASSGDGTTRSMGVEADGGARLRTPRRESQSKTDAAAWHFATLEACQALCLQRRGAVRTSSSASAVVICGNPPLIVSSCSCHARSVCDALAIVKDPACTTYGIGSPS